MKKLMLASVAALTLFSACRNVEQEVPDSAAVKTVRFHAGNAATRTAFAEPVDGLYQTLWTENDSDVLLSLNYGKAESSAVTPSADGTTASFEASFDASAATSPYTFYAVSPASAARAISPSRNAWSVYIAADQKPLENSVDEAAQLLVAKSAAHSVLPDEVDLHFSHLTAYGRVTLKNLELDQATVSKVELLFSTPVVGEWYWAEDGTLTSNGASHTITLDTDASGDLWFACAPVDVSGARMTLSLYTDRGLMTKEIVFPEGRKFNAGKVARFSVDMAGVRLTTTDVFLPVTDASTLKEGDKVLIVNADGTYALAGQSNDGNPHREQAAVTVSEGQITDPGEATVLTVSPGTTSGTWAFHTGTGYLSANASNNILKEAPSQSSFTDWSVIISNQKATLKAGDGASRFIRYHASNGRFSCYSSATSQKDIVLYRMKSYETGPVADDPLTVQSEYGSYISGAERTYVKGTDQLVRSYPDGDFQFAILRPADKEQLLISGFDPTTLAKGDEVTVTASWRMGKEVLLKEQSFRLTVVKEDGSKVWLGDGSGQGFIIKK